MDEKIRTEFHAVSGGIYLFLAFIMGCIGIGGLFSYPDPAWWFGLVFTISSLLFLYSGIDSLRKHTKKEKEEKIICKELKSATSVVGLEKRKEILTSNELLNPLEVLASWTFKDSEWSDFRKAENKFRIQDSLLLGILIAVFSAWIIRSEGEDWVFSIIFGFSFALIFIVLKYFVSRNITTVSPKNKIQVVISPYRIMLNEKLFSLKDEERWLGKVLIKEENGKAILEFTYYWNTRSGTTNDFLLIPIPEGKREEAEQLVREMKAIHGI